MKLIYRSVRWTIFVYALILGFTLDARTVIIRPGDSMKLQVLNSHPNDTLLVQKGEYRTENIEIKHTLVILGVDYPVLISESGDEILTILADSVLIHGMEFRGVKTNYLKEVAAIHVNRGKHALLSNNRIIDCFFGIYLERANHAKVIGNVILGTATVESASGNAIHAWYCENLIIKENEVRGHRDGIYFEFVHHSTISKNHSEKNTRYGLHFMFSNEDAYIDNVFINNGVGVAVMFSNGIAMKRNIFKENWGRSSYGLLLKEIRDGVIEENQFIYNTIGVYVEGSSRIVYQNNNFVRNGCSMTISGGCERNDIIRNNFINNHLDFEIHGSISGNLIDGNHWSGYTGYDLDRDGVGDVPYYPVKLFSHVLSQVPEAIVLMRSLLVDLINYAESVSPVFTPLEVFDNHPSMLEIP